MIELFDGLTTYCCSVYNTAVGTPTFAPGTNAFAGEMPDGPPDFAFCLAHDAASRNPHSKIRTPEFCLIVRAPRSNAEAAVAAATKLSSILGCATNAVPGHPCFVRAISEPGATGEDAKKRFVMLTKFTIWSVTL